MLIPAKSGLLAALLIGGFTLTACGDTTADSNGTPSTSIAPLERGPKESTARSTEPKESGTNTGDRTSESRDAAPDRPRPADPQPQDQGAREIDEIPAPEAPRSPEDIQFLGDISDKGIDVEGVQNQLIGTASTVCDGGDNDLARSTLPAVAGQLVQQGRTDKSVDDLVALIEGAAKNAYC